ncbi:MAG: hypothetical protein MZV64_51565 [Ignavibacteriales bacterium]|nr:hypothetical protein [Ignavibacteriales bacterium]
MFGRRIQKQFTLLPEMKLYSSIYKLNVDDDEIELFHKDNYNTSIQLSKNGKTLYFLKQRTDLPAEIFSQSTDGKNTLKRITFTNEEILSQLEMNPVETFWCEGANGDKVQSILVKPPFFDPNKKYPMMFLIHGGPQGAWEDNFHYRWNLQMFAGARLCCCCTQSTRLNWIRTKIYR